MGTKTNSVRAVPAQGGDPLVDEIIYDNPAAPSVPPDNASEAATGPRAKSDLNEAAAKHSTTYP